jgi:Ca2+-binding RTX toxin-like protein
MQREGEGAVLRQGRSIAVVVAFLIGCALLLLVVGCSGVRSGTTKKGQGSSPQATASEVARCEDTRTIHRYVLHTGKVRYGSEQDMKKAGKTDDMGLYATNDLPGCPNKGGVLLGTDKPDKLAGKDGDDKIRGLGAKDLLFGGDGNDVIYAGPGDDTFLAGDDGAGYDSPAAGDDVIYGGPGDEREIIGGPGDDVIYGGDSNDFILETRDRGHDKIYCGEGKDGVQVVGSDANKKDYGDSSCEGISTLPGGFSGDGGAQADREEHGGRGLQAEAAR